MRVSCASHVDTATEGLVEKLAAMGITPIVTSQVIRVVYEGDRKVGEQLVDLFGREPDHDVVFYYDKNEQSKSVRREIRRERRGKKCKNQGKNRRR